MRLTIRFLACVFSIPASISQDISHTQPAGYSDIGRGFDFPASEAQLDTMRSRGDLRAERLHVWRVFAGLVRPASDTRTPIFLTWYGAGEAFDAHRESNGARDLAQAFSTPTDPGRAPNASAPPRIIRGHYNLAAYRHIRAYGLFSATRLKQLAARENEHSEEPRVESVPAFPRDAIVLKTVWWPVPANGSVALPVWDPASNPPSAAGNDYPSWARVVTVFAGPQSNRPRALTDLDFMGRRFRQVRAVGIDSFYHLTLDPQLAASIMRDSEARKVALMLLDRPLRAGDSLALVALHVATREMTDWVWGTLWWHDLPNQGVYASLRPADLAQPWRNYLLDVSFDSTLPRESDGTPHVAYNPWLEARFPDSGHGSGVVSNCMSCHARASISVDEPFRVTRGSVEPPMVLRPGNPTIRTTFLWSIPLQAR